MNDLLSQALGLFRNKVNLLLVDDDRHILKSLECNFTSPAFAITTCDDFNACIQRLKTSTVPWHCWILDIDLGENRTGIQVMQAQPQFPFVMILSGLQSMRVAADAVKQGALVVHDKDPDSFDRMYNDVCKIASLGYLLGGKPTQYLNTYRLLCDNLFHAPEEWAEKACVSVRQIHRICELHPTETPRATLARFYGLYAVLWSAKPPFTGALPPLFKKGTTDYAQECLKYCIKH